MNLSEDAVCGYKAAVTIKPEVPVGITPSSTNFATLANVHGEGVPLHGRMTDMSDVGREALEIPESRQILKYLLQAPLTHD